MFILYNDLNIAQIIAIILLIFICNQCNNALQIKTFLCICKSNFCCFHLKVLCLLSNRSCQAFKENGPIRMQHYSPPSVTIITLEAEQAFNCHSQLFCLQTKNFSKIFTGAKLPLCKELKCHPTKSKQIV